MQPNVPLFRKVVEHIEAHPNEWNQDWWVHQHGGVEEGEICGTTFCFAGWALKLTGHNLHEETRLFKDQYGDYSRRCTVLDGNVVNNDQVVAAACEELGVDPSDIAPFFYGEVNTPAEVREDITTILRHYDEVL